MPITGSGSATILISELLRNPKMRAEQDHKRGKEFPGFLIRPFFAQATAVYCPPNRLAGKHPLHCCGNMDSLKIPFSVETRISDKASVKEGRSPRSAEIIVK